MKTNKITVKNSALDIFYRVLSNCSILCLIRLSKYLAFIVSHSKNQISTQTKQNIKLCFPELKKPQQEKIFHESIQHTCCAFFELASLWHQPLDNVLNLIKTKQIDNQFFELNKAKIIIAPHHGSWELLNLWLAKQGTSYSLYKPAKSKKVDEYVFSKRTRNGAILVPANTSGLRKLMLGLKNKASCMILPDQRPAKNAAQIEAPFFNHPTDTSLLIKRLAKINECNVFIASITRDLTSGKYNLTVKSLKRSAFLKDDLASATYLNNCIQDLIYNNSSQYQWAYRRFSKQFYSNL